MLGIQAIRNGWNIIMWLYFYPETKLDFFPMEIHVIRLFQIKYL